MWLFVNAVLLTCFLSCAANDPLGVAQATTAQHRPARQGHRKLPDILCALSQDLCLTPDFTRAPSPSPPGGGGGGPSGPAAITLGPAFFEVFTDQNPPDLNGISLKLSFVGAGQSYTVTSGPGLDTAFSTQISVFNGEIVNDLPLGFTMPLPFPPSGTFEIDVGTFGWIRLVGGEDDVGNEDCPFGSELDEFLASPRIAAFLADLDFRDEVGPGGGLFFDTGTTDDGLGFVLVTWNNIPSCCSHWDEFTNSNTFQVKLFENGDIILTWDSLTETQATVGVSAGNLPTSIPETDISQIQFGTSLPSTFYEIFDDTINDLAGNPTGTTIELVFNGFGEDYTVIQGPAFTSPSTELTTRFGDPPPQNHDLGFPMPLPFAPGVTTNIDIANDGWIGLVGGLFTIFSRADFSESEAEFLLEFPRLAMFWDSMTPALSTSPDTGLYFDTGVENGVQFAMVTWLNVPESTGIGENSFQAKLWASGNISLTWGPMDNRRGLVGLSAGVLPTDISAVAAQL